MAYLSRFWGVTLKEKNIKNSSIYLQFFFKIHFDNQQIKELEIRLPVKADKINMMGI